MANNVSVPLSTLMSWQERLDKKGASAAFNISEEIYDIIEGYKRGQVAPAKIEFKELKFADIQIGKNYRVMMTDRVKAFIRGAEIQIVEKRRTNVVGALVSAIPGHAAGARFAFKPGILEEI